MEKNTRLTSCRGNKTALYNCYSIYFYFNFKKTVAPIFRSEPSKRTAVLYFMRKHWNNIKTWSNFKLHTLDRPAKIALRVSIKETFAAFLFQQLGFILICP